jgi:hypothetical protein
MFQNSTLAANEWWASVYTKDQVVKHGALFCAFNIGGNEENAYCYFKNVDGVLIDEFTLVSNLN